MSYEFIWTSLYRQSDLFAFIKPQDFQIMLENMIIRFYASLRCLCSSSATSLKQKRNKLNWDFSVHFFLIQDDCKYFKLLIWVLILSFSFVCSSGWRRERDFFDDTASVRSEGSNVRGGPRGRGKGRGRGRGRGRGNQ